MKYYNIRISKRTKELINDFISITNNKFNISEALEKALYIISKLEYLDLNQDINSKSYKYSSSLKFKIYDRDYEFINTIKNNYKLKSLNSTLELIFYNSIKYIEKEKELDGIILKIEELKSLIYSKNLDDINIMEIENVLEDAKERISEI
mgnify:CR=1 FL=1